MEPLRDPTTDLEQDMSKEILDIEAEDFNIGFEDGGIYGDKKEINGQYIEDFDPVKSCWRCMGSRDASI